MTDGASMKPGYLIKFGMLMIALALTGVSSANAQQESGSATPQETEAIAKEAFIYAYPMLFNYKTLYQQTQDRNSKAYIGGWGNFATIRKCMGPKTRK
jgi:hypothetical protein